MEDCFHARIVRISIAMYALPTGSSRVPSRRHRLFRVCIFLVNSSSIVSYRWILRKLHSLPVLPRLSLDRHQFPPSLPSHDFGVAEQRRWQFSRPLNQLRRLQVIGADAGSVVFFYPRRYVETLVPRTRRGFAWSTVSAFSFALRFLSLGFTQFYFDLLFFSAQHPSVLDRFSCEITHS